MINTSKINHRGEDRLKIEFPYNESIANQVRQIKGSAWSRTQVAWHIPFTDEALDELKRRLPDIELPQNIIKKAEPAKVEPIKVEPIKVEPIKVESVKAKPLTVKPIDQIPTKQKSTDTRNLIKIDVIGRKILLKMPKDENDIKFINTLKYSKWDKKMFIWEIPNYPGNLDLINDHFKGRNPELVVHDKFDISLNNETRSVGNKELLIIKTKTGRLRLIFGFDKALLTLIKKYPYYSWDSKNKWWTIPFSEIYLNQIQSYALEQGLKVSYEEEPAGEMGVKRISAFDVPNYRECPEGMILKLKEIRYSPKTIKVYKALFEEFINFYYKYDINKIDETQIISFLRFLVIDRKVSTSYQNQSINAIKFYYEKVLGGQRKFYFVDRPKKERTLPTVLNEDEVVRLFKSVDNIKHKCMLMLAYSSGLRLGEILRLRLVDIDRERMQIRVVQSKGRKDRYAKLSAKFTKVLDQYCDKEQPKDFVFEGAKGAEYSPTSLQNIIRAAAAKAGIQKHTTMHTLRHTFATHSLENGVDLRYIQSMLGHESSKTTEIYTHITTKGFDQIKSPLDNLDI